MDLIYTNAAKEDQGVLFDYEFDLAFGADENTFECTIPAEKHCCEAGSFLYIEGTEYGGIVDSIKVNTEQNTITYIGRTWHGILEGVVIEPPQIVLENAASRLPDGYQEVEFIESSGTQYIDVGFKANQNTRVSMVAKMTKESLPSFFFGSRNSSYNVNYGILVNASGVRSTYGASTVTIPNASAYDRAVIDKNKNVCTVNDASVTNTESTFQTEFNLFLFASNEFGKANYFGHIRLESCQIYDNGTLIRDFVPCVNPDGAVGLYDLVTAAFYRNNGTGTFTAGESVAAGVQTITTTKYDYYVAKGEGNAVLAGLIEYLGLTDIFTASEEDSGIHIAAYSFRYVDAYSGICQMLAEYDGKLKLKHDVDKVILYTEPLLDFSRDEEFDSSQVDFTVQKNFRPVNHLICLGTGDLKDRHVIHLFTDENGGIQPYKTTEHPVEDADYILDQSGKLLTGMDEVAEVLDYPSAQTVENFVKLSVQPSDWAKNYASYFTMDDSGNFVKVAGIPSEKITLLTAEPEDWDENYAAYFQYVDGELRSVEAATTENFRELLVKPVNWETNYQNYYVHWSNGIEEDYVPVSGISETRYVVQTQRPSDWKENYSAYYERINGKYERVNGVYGTGPFNDHVVYPPGWRAKRYYTAESYTVAPEWSNKSTYYTKCTVTWLPAFVSGSYYSRQDVLLTPSFLPGVTFKKVFDHFAELVKNGLERLKKSFNCDSVNINLDLEGSYDIGDIVGASEHITGIAVWQPITKKIVTIKDGMITISYKVGD